MADIYIDVDTSVVLPLNMLPLIDSADFLTIEDAISASSLRISWNFCPTGGSPTQTTFSPGISGGPNDMFNIGHGMYTIEIPASGGSLVNNDTEGVGWFTGSGLGVCVFRSPMFLFRAAAINNTLIDGTSASTVVLATIQPSITWAQQKIVADVSLQGALDIKNGHDSGYGIMVTGSATGIRVHSDDYCAYFGGGAAYGIYTSTDNVGIYAGGGNIGLYAYGSGQGGLRAGGYTDDQYGILAKEVTQLTTGSVVADNKIDQLISGSALSDGKIDTIDTNVDQILVDTGTTLDGKIDQLISGSALSDGKIDIIDANVDEISGSMTSVEEDILAAIIEDEYDFKEVLRIMFAVLSGSSTGGGTSTITFKDVTGTLSRISATVDENGNRTSVTRNGSDV